MMRRGARGASKRSVGKSSSGRRTQRAADDDVFHSLVHAARDRARDRSACSRVRVAEPAGGDIHSSRSVRSAVTDRRGPA